MLGLFVLPFAATSLWLRNVAPVFLFDQLNQDVVAVIALVPDHFATRVFMYSFTTFRVVRELLQI